jgi:hypothetical protein
MAVDGSKRRDGGLRLRPSDLMVVVGLAPWAAVVVHASMHLPRSGINRGDFAFLELATRSALHGRALVGPYSRFGWDHPGPAAFYWFAPFYRGSGQAAASLGVAAAAAFGLSLLAIVVAARRAGGVAALFAASALAALVVPVWGWRTIGNAWNPLLVLAPLVVTAVLAAATASGVDWAWPALALAASFCVQTHVGTAPVVGTWLAMAVGLDVWRSRRRSTRWLPRGLAVVTVLAMWALPIGQQLGPGPGNLGELLRFFRASDGHHPLGEVLRRVLPQIAPQRRGIVGRTMGAKPVDGLAARSVIGAVVVVVAAAVAGVRSHRRGRVFEASLCMGALVAIVVEVVSLRRASGALEGYLTLPASAIGAVAWLGIGSALGQDLLAAARNRSRLGVGLRRAALLGAAVAVAPLVVDLGTGPHPSAFYVHQNHPVEAARSIVAVREAVGPTRRPVRIDPSPGTLLVSAMFANELERGGVRITVDDRLTSYFGQDRRSRGCEGAVLHIEPKGLPPAGGAGRVVTVYDGNVVQLRTTGPAPGC